MSKKDFSDTASLTKDFDLLKQDLALLASKNKELEAQLQRTKELSWSAKWELDLLNKNIDWSKEMYDILDLAEDVKPDMRTFNEQLPPICKDKLNGAIRKVFLTKENYSFNHLLQRKNGEMLTVRTDLMLKLEESGRAVKLIGLTTDITSIITAQQELQQLSMIASKTSNAVIVTDNSTKVEWINEGLTRMLGYRLDEIKGNHLSELLSNKELPILDPNVLYKAMTENHSVNEEMEIRTKKGNILAALVNITPILDYELNPEKYISIISDISVQKENERALQRQEKKIESQKQLLENKNKQLQSALDELSKVKINRKSLFFSIATAIVLVILTEAFMDPIIDKYYSLNVYISLAIKILIALLLKPMENIYERILLKRAVKLKSDTHS